MSSLTNFAVPVSLLLLCNPEDLIKILLLGHILWFVLEPLRHDLPGLGLEIRYGDMLFVHSREVGNAKYVNKKSNPF